MALCARRFREGTDAVNRRDWEGYRPLLASDFRFTDFAAEVSTRTADEFIIHVQNTLAPFSDEQVTITRLTATGCTVIGEVLAEGTHTGPLVLPAGVEIAASFREFRQHLCIVCEYDEDGIAHECRAYANPLELLGHLDLVASRATAP